MQRTSQHVKSRRGAALAGVALAVAVSAAAAGCGGSSSKSSDAGATVKGGNGFCAKLANFDLGIGSDIAGAASSPQAALQKEAADYKKLEEQAPDAIKKPFSDLVSYFSNASTADKQAASGDTQALQQLESQESSLAGDEQQLTGWEVNHCHAG